MQNNSNLPLVSVIIPTYNSGKTIEQCISSILKQTYPQVEIIVVDGGSTDNTLTAITSRGIEFYVIDGIGMSEATNVGAAKSRGKYIYRVDSDVVVDTTLIQDCVTACEKFKYDAIGVFWNPDPNISFWASVRRLEKESYKHDASRRSARFVDKRLFERVRGYDPKLVAGEDYDFYNRIVAINARVGEVQSEELHLGEPKNLFEISKKAFTYGKTIGLFLKTNSNKGIQQMNPIRIFTVVKQSNPKTAHMLFALFFYYFILYFFTFFGIIIHSLNTLHRNN
jgi:glycosyltransferase involved in cell wall biosynthesis